MADASGPGGTVTVDRPPAAASSPPGPAALPLCDRGRYELIAEHAHGGLGRVWQARDRHLGRVVALKEMITDGGPARARFVREALVTARLEHPAIVPVHEAGRWESGEPFYVMKLVSGRTLAEVVRDRTSLAERMALLPAVIAVVDAMAYAHAQGVLHRDLKPGNVLIGDFGETVVIDWGLAKDVRSPEDQAADEPDAGSDTVTRAGTVVGTPSFMPPEQARGETVDARSDVYGLGALLYFVLSGEAPYDRGPSAEVLVRVRRGPPRPVAEREPRLSVDLAAIVDKAMAREPGARYGGAQELAGDLKRFATGQLVSAHAYSLAQRVERWIRRHRGASAATAVFVVLATIGGAAFLVREQRLRRAAEVERDRADQKTRALLEKEGRDELAAGHPAQAAAYLVDALRRDPRSATLRWLAGDAVRPMARLEHHLVGHTRDVPYVSLSRDGARAVTASNDGTARVWDLESGRALAVLGGKADRLEAASISPDGSRVAVVAGGGIDVYPAAGGERLLRVAVRNVYRVWFTPDGARLIVGGFYGELRLVDAATGRMLQSLVPHADRVHDLAFSPDGARFATASWDRTVKVWDSARFTLLMTLADHEGEVVGVAYSRDGRWLVTVEEDVYLHVRRADSGARVYTLRQPEEARMAQATFAPDGQTIVTCAQDGVVRTWQASSGALLDAFDAQPNGTLMWSAFSADGRRLVTAGVGGLAHAWRLDRARAWRVLQHPLDERAHLYPSHWTPDGARIVTGDADGKLATWDAAAGTRLTTLQLEGDAFSVALVGERVAVTGVSPGSQPPALWDPRSGARGASLTGAASLVFNLAASPGGETIAAASYDGKLRLYGREGGAPVATFAVAAGRLSAVAFRPDGRQLAVASDDGRVQLIARDGGAVEQVIAASASFIDDVSYSPDGRRLVTAGRQDHTARVWDAASGRLELTLVGHHGNLMDADFSPDGALIATVGMDHLARLWDARSGELLRTIPGATYTAAFAPGGRELLTTGYYGYAVIWDLAVDGRSPEELAALIAGESPYRLIDGRLRTR